jgi:signal peptidase I
MSIDDSNPAPSELHHAAPPVVAGGGEAAVASAPTEGAPESAAQPPARESHGVFREWILPLLAVVMVLSFLRSAVADWNDVPTGSMKPTIVEGDRIFVNKAAYDLRLPFTLHRLATWGDPNRTDIVVLFSPDDGRRLVKRVIGIPGDRIELREGHLLINGEPAHYGPLDPTVIAAVGPEEQAAYRFAYEEIDGLEHPVMLAPWILNSSYFGPIVVPEGCYFVMGDNRGHSRDSRVFGFVNRRQIVGRATTVVLSKVPHEIFQLRADRFFLPLH